MIRCLVFSKDRPMQLEAYLESLAFCSGIDESQIYVIAPTDEHYRTLIASYRGLTWFFESGFGGSFHETLSHVLFKVFSEEDLVLFGCDDVVYIRMFNLTSAELILRSLSSSGVICFSLRLGTNLRGCVSVQVDNPLYRSWRWTGKPLHFGYPFELMASIYPVKLAREISKSVPELKSPNHLEVGGIQFCRERAADSKLCMYNTPSYAVAQDVNRVQSFFPNEVHGSEEHSSRHLLDLYRSGCRLEWSNLFGISPSDAFVGAQYWKIVQQDGLQSG